jgi:hypothetical protein
VVSSTSKTSMLPGLVDSGRGSSGCGTGVNICLGRLKSAFLVNLIATYEDNASRFDILLPNLEGFVASDNF